MQIHFGVPQLGIPPFDPSLPSPGLPGPTTAYADAIHLNSAGYDIYAQNAFDLAYAAILLRDCNDGADNDGDALVDLGDPGCDDANDESERSPLLPCDDGMDNDGQGDTDFPADPGCLDPLWHTESPQCQDGLDNDDATGTDFDGGDSVLGVGNGDPAGEDPQCSGRPWKDKEHAGKGCGLGAGAALPFAALFGLRRRAKRRVNRS